MFTGPELAGHVGGKILKAGVIVLVVGIAIGGSIVALLT